MFRSHLHICSPALLISLHSWVKIKDLLIGWSCKFHVKFLKGLSIVCLERQMINCRGCHIYFRSEQSPALAAVLVPCFLELVARKWKWKKNDGQLVDRLSRKWRGRMIQVKPNYFKINKVYFHGSALMSFPDIFKNLYHFISKVTRRDYRGRSGPPFQNETYHNRCSCYLMRNKWPCSL